MIASFVLFELLRKALFVGDVGLILLHLNLMGLHGVLKLRLIDYLDRILDSRIVRNVLNWVWYRLWIECERWAI